jgi:hypothetical protein
MLVLIFVLHVQLTAKHAILLSIACPAMLVIHTIWQVLLVCSVRQNIRIAPNAPKLFVKAACKDFTWTGQIYVKPVN